MRTVRVDANMELIQTFRLQHAIAEAGYRISVPASTVPSWNHILKWFPGTANVTSRRLGAKTIPTCVDHAAPKTAFAGVSRPLIFPNVILSRLQSRWSAQRSTNAGFVGLLTPKRQAIMQRIPQEVGTVVLDSRVGRKWPEKAWDDNYYLFMLNLKFAICPPGDFSWSYRFFEAAMCGAIPVVTEPHPSYDGFQYLTLEAINGAVYSDEIAYANFARVHELVTLSSAEIHSAMNN